MSLSGTKAIILDIEGTVCPITFVKDVLFPYSLEALPPTLELLWDDESFAPYRSAFPPEFRSSKPAFQAHFEELVRNDVKASYLKKLQGYLWRSGYFSGKLRATLFPDVVPMLLKWREMGLQIMIYSSGSVEAQKLLFGHTAGEPSDLTYLISDWFDTVNAGVKTMSTSYEAICIKHGISPKDWLFLSDSIQEVDASTAAGMNSRIVSRPGNAPIASDVGEGRVIRSFEELNTALPGSG